MSRFSTYALILAGAAVAVTAAAYDNPRPLRADDPGEVGYVLAGIPSGGKLALLPTCEDQPAAPVLVVPNPIATTVAVD